MPVGPHGRHAIADLYWPSSLHSSDTKLWKSRQTGFNTCDRSDTDYCCYRVSEMVRCKSQLRVRLPRQMSCVQHNDSAKLFSRPSNCQASTARQLPSLFFGPCSVQLQYGRYVPFPEVTLPSLSSSRGLFAAERMDGLFNKALPRLGDR